jgi:hypothetical protein
MKVKVIARWVTAGGQKNSQEFIDVEAPQEEDAEATVIGQITAAAVAANDPVAKIVVRSYGTPNPQEVAPDQSWPCESGKPGCASVFNAPRKNRVPNGWYVVFGGKSVCPDCAPAYRQAYADATQTAINAKLPWNQ